MTARNSDSTRTPIAKGERDELRRIVRGDFKALTSEIDVRRAELLAEIEQRVASRFMSHESALEDMKLRVGDIVGKANLELSSLFHEMQDKMSGYELRWDPLYPPTVRCIREKRDEMRRAMIADLDARVMQAKAHMQRQEIDLLKKLSVDALQSTEAHRFLAEIPKVSELVPTSRLAELEAQFSDEEGKA